MGCLRVLRLRCGVRDFLSGDQLIEDIGTKVGAVWPCHGPKIPVDGHLPKIVWRLQRLKQLALTDDPILQIDDTPRAVGKRQLKTVITDRPGLSDAWKHMHAPIPTGQSYAGSGRLAA